MNHFEKTKHFQMIHFQPESEIKSDYYEIPADQPNHNMIRPCSIRPRSLYTYTDDSSFRQNQVNPLGILNGSTILVTLVINDKRCLGTSRLTGLHFYD